MPEDIADAARQATAPTRCPGCSREMRSLALPREPMTPLRVDVCDDCQALWLDANESQALTPGAVIALFRAIAQSQAMRREA